MKKNIILSLATILLLTTVGSAYAFSPMMGFGQDNEDVVTALQNNDYNAWKEAMGDHPMAEKITEENFSKFVQIHNLRMQIQGLEEELGIQRQRGPKEGMPKENCEECQTALENGDYNAWKEAMGDHPMAEKITEENFEQFAEMHKLMQEGKTDEANQIREELGFGFKNGIGRGKGFNK